MRSTLQIGLLAVALLVGGCSSEAAGDPSKCTQGATQGCTCSDGKSGSQVCSAAGFWQTCACGACNVTPTCAGKACGADDGCGNSCASGTCASPLICVREGATSSCKGSCPTGPQCTGKACGDDDGCAGKCQSGTCPGTGAICNAGMCTCKAACTTCGGDDGCGGKCTTGACDRGFKCSGTGTCAVDPTSMWVITFTNGTVTSTIESSTPDAMICLGVAGNRVCTAESPNTLSPTWGCAFSPIAASTLLAGIDVETFDNDTSSSGSCQQTRTTVPGDVICAKTNVALTPADFKAKTWTHTCTGMTFNATLSAL